MSNYGPPNIFVPYVKGKLLPETKAALDYYGDRVNYVDVGHSDSAYFYMLRDLWAEKRDFIVVEQDIVIRPGITLESFDVCHYWLCVSNYPYRNKNAKLYGGELTPGWLGGLGCCRFRRGLMVAMPGSIERAGNLERAYMGDHPARHWCALDGAIKDELWVWGVLPCGGHPTSTHLHDETSHGCDRSGKGPRIKYKGVYPGGKAPW